MHFRKPAAKPGAGRLCEREHAHRGLGDQVEAPDASPLYHALCFSLRAYNLLIGAGAGAAPEVRWITKT